MRSRSVSKALAVLVVLAVLNGLGIAFYRSSSLEIVAAAVRALFVPSMALGLALSIAWRFISPHRVRFWLQVVGSVLFFAPQAAAMALWHQSILLVLHQEAVGALWVLAVAIVLAVRAFPRGSGREAIRHRLTGQQTLRTAGLLVLALAAGLYGVVLTREFLGDLFLPRILVEGPVEQLAVRSGPRSIAVHRYVSVGGRSYEVTYDVFTRLRHGVAIRAEAGAGSKMLVNATL